MCAHLEATGLPVRQPREPRLWFLLIALALLLSEPHIWLIAGERAPGATGADDAGAVLEEFDVAKDGDVLMVPVQFADGTSYKFVVDTGTSGVIIDSGLLKHVHGRGRSVRAGRHGRETVFSLGDARVGRLPLHSDYCACRDLGAIREVSGHDIHGCLGMEFLRKYAVRIDFDLGRLAFLARAGSPRGTALPLSYSRGCPVIKARLGEEDAEFIVDSGAACTFCTVQGSLFGSLASNGQLVPARETSFKETAFGRQARRYGSLTMLTVAGYEHRAVSAQEADPNSLGLDWLSRFRVTFDFPEGTLFLDKGARFHEPPFYNLSGLTVRRTAGATVVEKVTRGSAAALAGIEAGDRLVEVDRRAVSDFGLYELYRILGRNGRTVRLKIEREGSVSVHRIVLGDAGVSRIPPKQSPKTAGD